MRSADGLTRLVRRHAVVRGVAPLVVVLCLAAPSPRASGETVTARELYERAVALDREARAQADSDRSSEAEAGTAIRRAVEAYRRVVWTFPRSGYCDNAL